jgi:hypothetical protein
MIFLYVQRVSRKKLVPVIFLQSLQVPAWQVSPFLASLDKVHAGTTRVVHRVHVFRIVIRPYDVLSTSTCPFDTLDLLSSIYEKCNIVCLSKQR